MRQILSAGAFERGWVDETIRVRYLLFTIGSLIFLTGLYAFFAPHHFYETIPGLRVMGPFNIHLVGDVGLAFAGSGACLFWGAWKRNRAVAICGAIWPVLHALFHVQIWFHRGLPFDSIAAFDWVAVIPPAVVALVSACRLREA